MYPYVLLYCGIQLYGLHCCWHWTNMVSDYNCYPTGPSWFHVHRVCWWNLNMLVHVVTLAHLKALYTLYILRFHSHLYLCIFCTSFNFKAIFFCSVYDPCPMRFYFNCYYFYLYYVFVWMTQLCENGSNLVLCTCANGKEGCLNLSNSRRAFIGRKFACWRSSLCLKL